MSELKLQQCRLDGRYDLRECLGRGSYAEIYVADDEAAADGSPRTVVIKALNTYLQGAPDEELEQTLTANFRNEALALDRVRHPNVINRLGHGTAIDLQGRTFHYLVLEYLPGGDMQALCRQHPLTLERSIYYLEQVAAGLEHAHDNNVIHRDVKPSNMLLSADHKTVKIADFGVAKIEAVEGAITRVGTDVYAAPEHHPLAQTGPLDIAIARTRQLTPAADVYSLAKTAYMLLTGEPPRRFSQKPISELHESVAGKSWAPFVLRVLRRATQSNPAERYQSVREFMDDLRDALMPHTQMLSRGSNGDRPTASAEARLTAEPAASAFNRINANAPPPPAFDAPPRTNAAQGGTGSHAHPRIVVPVAASVPEVLPERAPIAQQQPVIIAPHAPLTTTGTFPPVVRGEPRNYQLSSRARRWLVALLLITLFAGMLLATHKYVSGLRNNKAPAVRPQTTAAAQQSPVGREYIARIDVNLRSGPNRNDAKIGLADKGARVRVLAVSGDWYEVEILERQRPKDEPDYADRGWADSDYFRLK
jgi:serine/threonine protein kinase